MDPVIAHNAGKLLELVERSAFVGFWRLDARNGTLSWSEQLARLHGATGPVSRTIGAILGPVPSPSSGEFCT